MSWVKQKLDELSNRIADLEAVLPEDIRSLRRGLQSCSHSWQYWRFYHPNVRQPVTGQAYGFATFEFRCALCGSRMCHGVDDLSADELRKVVRAFVHEER